ncbi:MAG: hypothetical protein OCU12_08110 [Methanophagales archaeon]|nr:hypothetical protein [Methanophagales archaeon]
MIRKRFGQAVDHKPRIAKDPVDIQRLNCTLEPTGYPNVGLKDSKGADISGCWQWFERAGPYDSQARFPISGEWRVINVQTTPIRIIDTDVTFYKWYWYRVRGVMESGEVLNWWIAQIQPGT